MGWTGSLAESLGGSEAGLKLLLGQLFGYPLLLFYRKFLSNKDPNLQHVYFAVSGLMLGHWVIGPGIVHSLYAIIFTYILLAIAGGTVLSVVISLSFNMCYLLIGYWYTSSDTAQDYDVSWTMPQCVLCLRLIGLTIDVYDGKQPLKSLSKDQLTSYLPDCPGILEMLSHSFFIGGYFVGPQFPLRKFREFVRPDYHEKLPSSPSRFGFRRLLIGVGYMALHVIGFQFVPEHWPTTESYASTCLPLKLLWLAVWVKIILFKYVSIWLMAEGVCVVSGLSLNGVDESGEVDWTGCRNVKLRRLETATAFAHYIEAFNINTNGWVAKYVYKRLKFLNNKNISQFATLAFLSVWHGWHPGYYLTFINEFFVMKFEGEFNKMWERSKKAKLWKEHPSYNTLTSIIGWSYVHFFLPHCFLPFPLKSWNSIVSAYLGVYCLHIFFYVGWPMWSRPLKAFLDLEKKPTTEQLTDKKMS